MKPPILPEVNPKLSHLSRDQRVELYSQYYVKSNTEIIEKYNLTIKSNIHKVFEPKILDEVCTFCETPLWGYYPPKTGISDYPRKECPNCNHIIYESRGYRCTCDSCEKIRDEEKRLKREKELIDLEPYKKYIINQNDLDIDFESLTFIDKLYLLAYIYSQPKYNCPIQDLRSMRIFVRLSSNYEFTCEILKHLTDRKILKFNDVIELDYIKDYIERGDFLRIMQTQAFEINIKHFNEIENDILESLKSDVQNNKDIIIQICEKIAIFECFEFFKIKLNYIKCPIEKNAQFDYEYFFLKLLNHFSVSQIQRVIDVCIGNCSTEYLAGNRNKKQMPKLLQNGIEHYIKKALLESWKLNNLHEYKRLNPSIINVLLFEHILKSNKNWFEYKLDSRFIENCI